MASSAHWMSGMSLHEYHKSGDMSATAREDQSAGSAWRRYSLHGIEAATPTRVSERLERQEE
eukprot:1555662-Pleurochrysis_carterae.AAC.1